MAKNFNQLQPNCQSQAELCLTKIPFSTWLAIFFFSNVTSYTSFGLSMSLTKILRLSHQTHVIASGRILYFKPWGSDLYRSFSAAVSHCSLHQLLLCSSSECLHSLNTLTPLWPVCERVNYTPVWSTVLLLYSSSSAYSSSSPFASFNLPLCVLIFADWPLPPLFALLLLGLAEGERRGQERSVGEWVDNLQ